MTDYVDDPHPQRLVVPSPTGDVASLRHPLNVYYGLHVEERTRLPARRDNG